MTVKVFCPHCGKQIGTSTNPSDAAANAANAYTITLTPTTFNAAAANPLPIIQMVNLGGK